MTDGKQSSLPQEIRDIWTDAFKFHATFESMGNTPEEWKRCAFVMGQLSAARGNHPLAKELFLAVYNYLDKQRKAAALADAERRAGIDQAV